MSLLRFSYLFTAYDAQAASACSALILEICFEKEYFWCSEWLLCAVNLVHGIPILLFTSDKHMLVIGM